VPEKRSHRGPHPEDHRLFDPTHWPRLRAAVGDLSWLLTRGYAHDSSLKLVGDRYNLTKRQRLAVMRSSCSDQALADRLQRQVELDQLEAVELMIDGFNVLTTVEAAMSGGILLLGRDGCLRDMASMHGSYRTVDETLPAIVAAGELLMPRGPQNCIWLLDRPVSNSGRLGKLIEQVAISRQWSWRVELLDNPDRAMIDGRAIVATADSGVLDRCGRWANLAAEVVRARWPSARPCDLRDHNGWPA
jgi:hypothetical protein